MTRTDIRDAWAAGYIDGEGCFDSPRGRQIRLRVTNTHLPSLKRLRELYGGSLTTNRSPDGHRTQYVWTVYGDQCAATIRAIGSYLYEKRLQADLLLLLHSGELTAQGINDVRDSLSRAKRPDYGSLE